MSTTTIYWNNRDVIRVLCVKDSDKMKMTEIHRGNDGDWMIELYDFEFVSFENHKKKYEYDFHQSFEVRDYVFRRAFAGIYTEMMIQFKLKNDLYSLKLLEDMFTI